MEKEQQDINTIIHGCKDNNRKAQEQLYRNFYKAMMNICLRYTKNEEDAVEVLNNGFLKVFKNIKRYEPARGSLYTWVRTILINSCLDFIKVKNRMERHSEINEATNINIPAEVITKMKVTELLKMVRQLPPATQAVFNLYIIEGYNHKEIGVLLNISEGTSKWHLSEGRKGLQQMIQLEEANINE